MDAYTTAAGRISGKTIPYPLPSKCRRDLRLRADAAPGEGVIRSARLGAERDRPANHAGRGGDRNAGATGRVVAAPGFHEAVAGADGVAVRVAYHRCGTALRGLPDA